MHRLSKLVLAGILFLGLLATGSGLLITTVLGRSESRTEVLDESTEIAVECWCLACGGYRPASYGCSWQGKTRAQIEELLVADIPDARLLVFSKEQVLVLLPPGYCQQCLELMPQQGYISLTEGNQLAVFFQDGTLFKVYGEAPGVFLKRLQEGIPFFSPEECFEWLLNLTS